MQRNETTPRTFYLLTEQENDMTSHRKFAANEQNTGGSPGNLGQNKAEAEETSDEKLEHMGENSPKGSDKQKERKDQSK